MEKYHEALVALNTGFTIEDEYGNKHFAISKKCQKIIKKALKKAIRRGE